MHNKSSTQSTGLSTDSCNTFVTFAPFLSRYPHHQQVFHNLFPQWTTFCAHRQVTHFFDFICQHLHKYSKRRIFLFPIIVQTGRVSDLFGHHSSKFAGKQRNLQFPPEKVIHKKILPPCAEAGLGIKQLLRRDNASTHPPNATGV